MKFQKQYYSRENKMKQQVTQPRDAKGHFMKMEKLSEYRGSSSVVPDAPVHHANKSVRVQPRDSAGRFLSWDGTTGKKYTSEDIKKAFLAGLSDKTTLSFNPPSRKLELYLMKNNIT
jgi:hypothetical protein